MAKNRTLDIGNWTLSRRGFSLIELMFAMVLLTVIILGVMKLQTSNLTLSNTQNNELQAHFLASQGAEIVKGIGYSDFCDPADSCYKKIAPPAPNYSLTNASDENDMETISGGLFGRVLHFDKAGLPTAYEVTSIVKWTDSAGDHDVQAKRIIF